MASLDVFVLHNHQRKVSSEVTKRLIVYICNTDVNITIIIIMIVGASQVTFPNGTGLVERLSLPV